MCVQLIQFSIFRLFILIAILIAAIFSSKDWPASYFDISSNGDNGRNLHWQFFLAQKSD
jgi:hypothetical protein